MGHFTWWPADGFCHIQEYGSKLDVAVGAITGPPNCNELEEWNQPTPSPPLPPSDARAQPRQDRHEVPTPRPTPLQVENMDYHGMHGTDGGSIPSPPIGPVEI